jgi:hypothetical protein
MDAYTPPKLEVIGSLESLTLINVNKKGVSGDTITVGGRVIAVPGSSLA